MCNQRDSCPNDSDSKQIQTKRVIRDVDDLPYRKPKYANGPQSCSSVSIRREPKYSKKPKYQESCSGLNSPKQPEYSNKPKFQKDSCTRVRFAKEPNYEDANCQPAQNFVVQNRQQRDACLKCDAQDVESVANVAESRETLDCHYPTEDRMVKPLITYNGLTDIRYTTDKAKVIHESGVGVEYRLIDVPPEIEAPWCKRNGLQDYWMEDPKYARKSTDIYSTPYPCCRQQMRPANRNAVPARPQYPQAQPQGWDCCLVGPCGPKGPQGNNAIPCDDNKPIPKGRFRDIAPVIPREQEINWKENCNFK